MFAGKTRSLPLKDAPIRLALAFHANMRLGWKYLPGTNTLAYWEH